jgi:hypothetical protein
LHYSRSALSLPIFFKLTEMKLSFSFIPSLRAVRTPLPMSFCARSSRSCSGPAVESSSSDAVLAPDSAPSARPASSPDCASCPPSLSSSSSDWSVKLAKLVCLLFFCVICYNFISVKIYGRGWGGGVSLLSYFFLKGFLANVRNLFNRSSLPIKTFC